MQSELALLVISMDDSKVSVAARALINFLDKSLRDDGGTLRPVDANVVDVPRMARTSDSSVRGLTQKIEQSVLPDQTAVMANRAMLLLAIEMGYKVEVERACGPKLLSALSIGALTGIQILAVLATVLGWAPANRKQRVHSVAVVLNEGARLIADGQEKASDGANGAVVEMLEQWWQDRRRFDEVGE